MSETTRLLDRRNQIFGKGAHLFYEDPLHIVKAKGVELFNKDGTRFIDMYNNVPCIGHCHPHLIDAINQQVATLNVHNRYLHEAILSYGERLIAKHHSGIESIVMSCTGTEANEVAMQMAKATTDGSGFICTNAAYHGNSTAVRQLTRAKVSKLIKPIDYPETYRCSSDDPTGFYLDQLNDQIAAFQQEGTQLAALLICSLCANEGLPDIPKSFLSEATSLVHAAGGLMIADEVQAGLGRAGRWWGYELSEFKPDIVVMGKPLGAGIPLAATASSRGIVEQFRSKTGYFNTFASSPVQAAAGNAVLDVIEQDDLVDNANKVGTYLADKLSAASELVPQVGDIRQKGLFIGIEWVESRKSKVPDRAGAAQLVNQLKSKGYLLGNAGANGNVLKLRPPLVFSKSNADDFVSAYTDTVSDV